MKSNASYYRFFLLLLILLTGLNIEVMSQGTDSRGRGKEPKKFCMTIYVNPLQTTISSEEVTNAKDLVVKKGNSITGILDFDYFFARAVGINFGIGYNSYASQLSLDNWTTKFAATDTESEAYEMRITGKTIVEDQKISFICIPICLVLRFPAASKIGFYLKGGINLNIPMAKTYEGTGTFTYDGYYAAYPVLLQDIAAYGFPSNLRTNSSGTLEIKSFNPALVGSGNLFIAFSESIQLIAGVYYTKTLGSISMYPANANFRITSKASEMNSFMAGSTSAGAQGMGLNLGLRFYLK